MVAIIGDMLSEDYDTKIDWKEESSNKDQANWYAWVSNLGKVTPELTELTNNIRASDSIQNWQIAEISAIGSEAQLKPSVWSFSYGSNYYQWSASGEMSMNSAQFPDSRNIEVYGGYYKTFRHNWMWYDFWGSTWYWGAAYGSVDVVSDEIAIVSFTHGSNYSWYVRLIRKDVDSYNINYTADIQFNTAQTYYTRVIKLEENKFLLAFADNWDSGYINAIVGQVSWTNITWWTKVRLRAWGVDYIHAARVFNNKVVLGYHSNGNTYAQVITTYSGTTISFWTPLAVDAEAAFPYRNFDIEVLTNAIWVICWSESWSPRFQLLNIGWDNVSTLWNLESPSFPYTSIWPMTLARTADNEFYCLYYSATQATVYAVKVWTNGTDAINSWWSHNYVTSAISDKLDIMKRDWFNQATLMYKSGSTAYIRRVNFEFNDIALADWIAQQYISNNNTWNFTAWWGLSTAHNWLTPWAKVYIQDNGYISSTPTGWECGKALTSTTVLTKTPVYVY